MPVRASWRDSGAVARATDMKSHRMMEEPMVPKSQVMQVLPVPVPAVYTVLPVPVPRQVLQQVPPVQHRTRTPEILLASAGLERVPPVRSVQVLIQAKITADHNRVSWHEYTTREISW
eukprot:SAG31_NODE_1747_length_7364_cov_5.070750_2_plen_118_part_00